MKGLVCLLTGVALAAPVGASEIGDVAAFDPSGAEVVVLGEVHDNPAHHAAQAEIVGRIDPAAVVFEMLTPAQAETAETVGVDAGEAKLAEALGWSETGWPEFGMYYPVLRASAQARLFGAALPRETVRAAFSEGAAEVFGAGAGRFGLDTPLPAQEQAAREAGQLAAHCDALPDEMLPGMVAAQRLRDAHFARVTLEALEETGGPVAVITGNGHARTDRGIPAALSRAAPEVEVVALGQLEAPPEPPVPYDVWRVTAPVEREDPCAAFR
jgi:uncharacterized iron-regulated protein